ncbi:MAG: polyprenyl synthetase family protein [Christensenellales bacterium]|jgi:geranylgeranyl diphosphate synthase type II
MLWNERYEKYKSFFVKQLDNSVKQTELPFESGSMPQKLSEAMRYSLLAGGKRLRPVMLLAAAEAEGLKAEEAFNFAAAIEMIHTYSLIHDDLPAMDNDTLRRGKPTSHCKFGEWLAILSGDALLTEAFYMMSLTDNKNALKAIKEIAFRSGARGMIAGQVADMHFENKNPCKDDVRYINLHKTADLFVAAVKTGLILASADESKLKAAETYGENIGFAFQITDDILDIKSNSQTLGKSIGKDEKQNKATWVKMFGIEQAKKDAQLAVEKAANAAQQFDFSDGAFFVPLAQSILKRVK